MKTIDIALIVLYIRSTIYGYHNKLCVYSNIFFWVRALSLSSLFLFQKLMHENYRHNYRHWIILVRAEVNYLYLFQLILASTCSKFVRLRARTWECFTCINCKVLFISTVTSNCNQPDITYQCTVLVLPTKITYLYLQFCIHPWDAMTCKG